MEKKEIVGRLERVAREISEDEHLWECYDCGYRWKGSPCYYRPVCPRCDSEEITMVKS